MKLAIIGAGPGGLYAALSAAKRNIAVDLFEKRKVGEGIVCGECIFDSLAIMNQPEKGLLHRVDEMVLQGLDSYPFPMSRHRKLWMMDRRIWQQELAHFASKLGVVIHENVRITQERLRQMQQNYDWILDASGAPSVTSRLYGFSGDYFREYLLSHQVSLAADFSSLWPRIKIVCSANPPAEFQPAYYWIFPKNKETANVGVVCTIREGRHANPPHLKPLLADFIQHEGLENAAILEKGGGMGASAMLSRLAYGNILLVGDAAGLTSSLHGGGIDMACLSGILAVDAIVQGDAGVLRYREKLARYLSEKASLEKVAIRKMRTLNFHDFDHLLRDITSPSIFVRFKTALRHLDMFYPTVMWFGKKKAKPDWPV
ncbi:MAG TPA: NAD(P)/FAD-dependent oxidoreductase [Smithellaceae bacterium]|nr:NAD(P)/FAD-dependent oxidoreductase [Smithellaceae bacterium]